MSTSQGWRSAGRRLLLGSGPLYVDLPERPGAVSVSAGSLPVILPLGHDAVAIAPGSGVDALRGLARDLAEDGRWLPALQALGIAASACSDHSDAPTRGVAADVVIVDVARTMVLAAVVEDADPRPLARPGAAALRLTRSLLSPAAGVAASIVDGLAASFAGCHDDAVALLGSMVGPDRTPADRAAALLALAIARRRAGLAAPEAAVAARALRGLDPRPGTLDPFRAGALFVAARDADARGDRTRALNAANEAIGVVRRTASAHGPTLRSMAYTVLSEVLGGLGRHAEAVEAAVRAVGYRSTSAILTCPTIPTSPAGSGRRGEENP